MARDLKQQDENKSIFIRQNQIWSMTTLMKQLWRKSSHPEDWESNDESNFLIYMGLK